VYGHKRKAKIKKQREKLQSKEQKYF